MELLGRELWLVLGEVPWTPAALIAALGSYLSTLLSEMARPSRRRWRVRDCFGLHASRRVGDVSPILMGRSRRVGRDFGTSSSRIVSELRWRDRPGDRRRSGSYVAAGRPNSPAAGELVFLLRRLGRGRNYAYLVFDTLYGIDTEWRAVGYNSA